MVPTARCPTRAREIESGVLSDVESPARRRRVTLNLNSQGGGEQRADGGPAAAREGEATGIENEVNRVSVNHPDGDGSGNSVNQRVEGSSVVASAERMAGVVAPILPQVQPDSQRLHEPQIKLNVQGNGVVDESCGVDRNDDARGDGRVAALANGVRGGVNVDGGRVAGMLVPEGLQMQGISYGGDPLVDDPQTDGIQMALLVSACVHDVTTV